MEKNQWPLLNNLKTVFYKYKKIRRAPKCDIQNKYIPKLYVK